MAKAPSPATAAYLYCVVKSPRRPSLVRVPHGVPEATAPQVHAVGAFLWIVTADVPLPVYGPAALEPRLRDLDWVSRAALAHEAVIEHFSRLRAAVVIPAKLFTMFTTTAKAIEDVAKRRASIDRVMKRIAGCEEWGIRITRRPAIIAPVPAGRAASGAAFLSAKKAARDAVVQARTDAAAAAARAYRSLARHAREVHQRERRQEPGTNPPVLEAAFLVSKTALAKFKLEARRQAAACAAAGTDMTLTGPWPAYNFIGTRS
jgi:hypothetical protein